MLIDYPLRYGNNPHQTKASFSAPPNFVEILNGDPSYINILDILTGWQMTRDLTSVTGEVAAVSMKHCAPVGLAIPGSVDDFSAALLGIDEVEPTTSAYLRARSSDWSAAYGDVVVIFGKVNEELANILAGLVSDGIAATSYSDGALKILRQKKNGRYLIVKLDQHYEPPNLESREVFGIKLEQERNGYLPSSSDFKVSVGSPEDIATLSRDLSITVIAMKYSISNNMAIVSEGRTLSISTAQQSRILSTQLACIKFERFMRLQHPDIVDLVKSSTGKLTEKIDQANMQAMALKDTPLSLNEPTVLGSDGFIPFSDNIEEAGKYGIQVILEPEGALRSDEVEAAASEYGMTLVRTENRYFFH